MRKVQQLKTVRSTEFLTIEEAAKALDIKPTALRNYLCDGKLTTYKFKTLTLVKNDEIQERRTRKRNR